MSFILCTGSLDIWHRRTRLKGHGEALLSGASPGRDNGTTARPTGRAAGETGLRRDAPCLSGSGVKGLQPVKEGALRGFNIRTLQSRTATPCPHAA